MATSINILGPVEQLVAKQKRRILIVDDDREAAQMLGMLLEAMGQEVRVVWDSAIAMASAVDFGPHVAILDLDMPGVNGFELASQLREACGQSVGLIALSGWNNQATRERCRDLGFDRFFAKPTALDQIFFALSDYDVESR